MNTISRLMITMVLLNAFYAQAGVRTPADGGGQMVARLQAMVRQASKERDAVKTENARLKADLAKLTTEKNKLDQTNEKMTRRIAIQQSSHRKISVRQEQTYARLLEVVEKYKMLKQEKDQLMNEFEKLKGQFHSARQQVDDCAEHNTKLISAANELLQRYQNKGTFSALMQSEGMLQFETVEMENIVQEYEDRIRDGHYSGKLSRLN